MSDARLPPRQYFTASDTVNVYRVASKDESRPAFTMYKKRGFYKQGNIAWKGEG